MLHRCVATFLMLALPTMGHTEEAAVLATAWSRSGSVAPAYAWSVTTVIRVDGQVSVTDCKGYDSEGANCTTQTGTVRAERLEEIRAAVAASGLLDTPARDADDFPVGGQTSGGSIEIDGTTVVLPPFPAEADAFRVAAVLVAIGAALSDAQGIAP